MEDECYKLNKGKYGVSKSADLGCLLKPLLEREPKVKESWFGIKKNLPGIYPGRFFVAKTAVFCIISP